MNSKKIVAFCFVIAVIASECLKPAQKDGQCTSCHSQFILYEGSCFRKIDGCIEYLPGPICSQCESGYTIRYGQCFIQTEKASIKLLGLQQPTIQKIQLSLPQNKRQITKQSYEREFNRLNEYFADKYAQYISKNTQKTEQIIPSKSGTYLIIVYTSKSNIYQAITHINKNQKSTEISFIKQTNKNTINLSQIMQKIPQQKQLQNYQLLDLSISIDKYTLNLINQQQECKRITVQRKQLKTNIKLNISNITISEISREKIYRQHPYLENYRNVKNQYLKEYRVTVFTFGEDYTLSVQLRGYQFIVNYPVMRQRKGTDQLKEQLSFGRYMIFNELEDEAYVTSLKYLLKQFPQVKGAQITQVKAQIVAGMNFLITLKKDKQTYTFKLYHHFLGRTVIISGFKNNDHIFNKNHDYNTPQFFQSYNQIISDEKFSKNKIPPISYVAKQINQGKIRYQVFYDTSEYLYFIPENQEAKIVVLEYSFIGANLLGYDNMLGFGLGSVREWTTDNLVQVIQSKGEKITEDNIQSVAVDVPIYIVKFVMPDGTHEAVVEDNFNQLRVVQTARVSEKSCFELSQKQIQKSEKVSQIDSFLRNKYNLKQFQLKVVQTQFKESEIKYFYLYSNDKLKQIKFLAESSPNKTTLLSGKTLNEGYQIINLQNKKNIQNKMLNSIKKSNNGQNAEILYTQYNQSNYRGYISTGQQTKEVLVDSNDQISTKTISTRNYKILPQEFQFGKLIFPQILENTYSSSEALLAFKVVDFIKNRFSGYIKDPVLLFAQKQRKDVVTDTVTLFIKSSLGYLKIPAQVTRNLSNIKLKGLSILKQQAQYAQCSKYNLNGECLLCQKQKKPYQGSCFPEIPGCYRQAGSLCLKCEAEYLQQGYQCLRKCEDIFSL